MSPARIVAVFAINTSIVAFGGAMMAFNLPRWWLLAIAPLHLFAIWRAVLK